MSYPVHNPASAPYQV